MKAAGVGAHFELVNDEGAVLPRGGIEQAAVPLGVLWKMVGEAEVAALHRKVKVVSEVTG